MELRTRHEPQWSSKQAPKRSIRRIRWFASRHRNALTSKVHPPSSNRAATWLGKRLSDQNLLWVNFVTARAGLRFARKIRSQKRLRQSPRLPAKSRVRNSGRYDCAGRSGSRKTGLDSITCVPSCGCLTQRSAAGRGNGWAQNWSHSVVQFHEGLPANTPPPRNRFRPSMTGPGTATLNFRMAAPSSPLRATPSHSVAVTSASGN